ncbi:Adenylate kinase [bacterium AB1]|nr:Adenylate kinase [bacterium AB1]
MSYIYLLGKPCSGKGTIASYMKYEYGFSHFRASKILFQHINEVHGENSEIMQSILNGSHIVTGDEYNHVFLKSLKQINNNNIVFDGYPRELDQLNFLVNHHHPADRKRFLIILEIEDEDVFERYVKRVICKSCDREQTHNSESRCIYCNEISLFKRHDDQLDAIKNRINTYNTIIKSFKNFDYEKYNLAIHVIKVDNFSKTSEIAQNIFYIVKEMN